MGFETAKKISFRAFCNSIKVEDAECELHCPWGCIEPCPMEDENGEQVEPCSCYYFLFYLYEEVFGL